MTSTAVFDGNPSTTSSKEAYDLMVMLPKKGDTTKVEVQLQIRKIINHLSTIGYSHVALTHTIYGRPRPSEDEVDKAIPKSLWTTSINSDGKEPTSKKRRRETADTTSATTEPNTNVRVLRRLHAVIENLSDVAGFLSDGKSASILKEYDLVSVSPRNEAVFQSVCQSATSGIDIITLDYHATRGLRLPYRIRPSDIQALKKSKEGILPAFEIQYSPALLHQKQRKALMNACRELQTALNPGGRNSAKDAPQVLLSSGDRTFEESDQGTLALRMPGDLVNLMEVVCQFDSKTSLDAIKRTGNLLLRKAEERRFKVRKFKSGITAVNTRIATLDSLIAENSDRLRKNAVEKSTITEGEEAKRSTIPKVESKKQSDDGREDEVEPDDGDGFIAM